MERRTILLFGAVLLGGCCLLLTAVVGYLLITGSSNLISPGVDVAVFAPERANVGVPFDLEIRIDNQTAAERLIDSIDIETSYLDGLLLRETSPPPDDQFAIPLVGFQSYTYERTLNGNGSQTIIFTFEPTTTGTFSGAVDVCIDSATACDRFLVETEVLE